MPEQLESFIQGIGALTESLRLFYDSCIKQKFTPQQALTLTIGFMQSTLNNTQNNNKE
jgi:hypothetical protein